MPSEYVAVVLLLALAGVVAAAVPILYSLISRGRVRPDAVKTATYECGVADIDQGRHRTFIPYYLTSLIFILFDIEIAFLYPWAVVVKKFDSRVFIFGEMALFLGVLALAYAWLWRKGALDWE